MKVSYKPGFFKFEKNFDFNDFFKMINDYSLPSYNTWQENSQDVFNSVFTIDDAHKVDYFKEIFNILNQKFNPNNFRSNLHMFVSFKNGTKGKLHSDKEDVYIFGLHGHTCYMVENQAYMITPGDFICIKKNTPHQAIGLTPRIIASFGIYS